MNLRLPSNSHLLIIIGLLAVSAFAIPESFAQTFSYIGDLSLVDGPHPTPIHEKPSGIAYDGDKFYVLGGAVSLTGVFVFVYNSDGSYDHSFRIPNITIREGMTYANGNLYLVDGVGADGGGADVLVYTTDGTQIVQNPRFVLGTATVLGDDFGIGNNNNGFAGIAFDSVNDIFYVTNIVTDKVYVFNNDDDYSFVRDFDLLAEHGDPYSLEYFDDKLYIGNDSTNNPTIYVYDVSDDDDVYGTNIAAKDIPLRVIRDVDTNRVIQDESNNDARGMAYANNNFYVADISDDNIFIYSAHPIFELNTLVGPTTSAITTTAPSGITHYNDLFYTVGTTDNRIYVHNLDGTDYNVSGDDNFYALYVDTATPENSNDSPEGITALDDKFYIVNNGPDRIFVYDNMGVHDSAASIDLFTDDTTPANSNADPKGITHIGSVLYVLDSDKVHRYSTVGTHATGFDLHAANASPEGIFAVGDRLFVADTTNKFFVYDPNGNLIDRFDQRTENDDPKGVTAIGERLYVLDGDKFIYSYYSGHLPLLVEAGNTITNDSHGGTRIITCDDPQDAQDPDVEFESRPDYIDTPGNYTLEYSCSDSGANPKNITIHQRSLTIIDTTGPTPVITSDNGSNGSTTPSYPIYFTINFGEPVNDFDEGDVTVTVNGSSSTTSTLTSSVNGQIYTFSVTPTTNGSVTVNIAADVAVDGSSNNNKPAVPFMITFTDGPPTPIIASVDGVNGDDTFSSPINFTIDFGEPVMDFLKTDILLSGVAASGNPDSINTDDGQIYTFSVIPSMNGSIIVDIAAGVATDTGTNNNLVAEQFIINYTAPPGFALNSTNLDSNGITFNGTNLYVVDDNPDDSSDSTFYVYPTDGSSSVQYTLTGENDDPSGTTVNDTTLYVLDNIDTLVYAYSLSGVYDSSKNFDLGDTNTNPTGITTDGTNFYVVDDVSGTTDVIYVYFATDTSLPPTSFTLDPNNADAVGITTHETSFYVVDSVDNKIYVYLANGTLHSEIDLNIANVSPTGISTDGISLYVSDSTSDRVHSYDLPTIDLTLTLPLNFDNLSSQGITHDGTNFYVVDDVAAGNNDDKLYIYSASGILSSSITLNSANRSPIGVTNNMTTLYVLDNDDTLVYAYSLSNGVYAYDSTKNFDLDSANTNPVGITTDGTNFYVVDDDSDAADTVYVYSAVGASLESRSFRLDSNNTNPIGITIDNTSFYVVDSADNKIYVYLADGTSHSNFMLDAENISPTGIATGNG